MNSAAMRPFGMAINLIQLVRLSLLVAEGGKDNPLSGEYVLTYMNRCEARIHNPTRPSSFGGRKHYKRGCDVASKAAKTRKRISR